MAIVEGFTGTGFTGTRQLLSDSDPWELQYNLDPRDPYDTTAWNEEFAFASGLTETGDYNKLLRAELISYYFTELIS